MWIKWFYKGKDGEYEYQVKCFDERSEFGIDGGRISKLWISLNGKTVCNYDRGWAVMPMTQETKELYVRLLEQYN